MKKTFFFLLILLFSQGIWASPMLVPQISFVKSGQLAHEGERFSIELVLSKASNNFIYVPYEISGVAHFPDDHNLSSGMVLFFPGQVKATLSVDLFVDQTTEPAESISVKIVGPLVNATFGSVTTHTVNIPSELPGNHAPVMIGNQNFQANEDRKLSLTLNGATDSDGDTLTYALVSAPAHGILTNCLQNSSQLTCDYFPPANFSGVVNFSYRAYDARVYSESNSTVTINVNAVNDKPIADFSVDTQSGQAPLLVQFDASSSTDVDGEVVSYHWEFADGQSADGKIVSHSFSHGTYLAKLTVTDNLGAVGTKTIVITSIPDTNPPELSFNVNDGDTIVIKTPTIIINYSDLDSGIDLTKILMKVDGVDVSNKLQIGENQSTLQFTVDWPLAQGEHEFYAKVFDKDGNSSEREISITAELGEASPSYILGHVEDKNGNPIEGATVENTSGPVGVKLSDQTDSEGNFKIQFSTAGHYLLKVRKAGTLSIVRDVDTEEARDINSGTFVLENSDPLVTQVTASSGGTAQNSTGTVTVDFPPNVLPNDIQFSSTEYLDERTLPGPLPELSAWTYAFDTQPRGTVLNGPANMSFKDNLNFPDGTNIVVGYFDEIIGRWFDAGYNAIVSNGKVKLAGSNATLDPDFRPVDCNQPTLCANGSCEPPSIETTTVNNTTITNNPTTTTITSNRQTFTTTNSPTTGTPSTTTTTTNACTTGCRINMGTGELMVDHELPSIKRFNQPFTLGFTYSSTAAHPTMFVGTRLRNRYIGLPRRVDARISVGPYIQEVDLDVRSLQVTSLLRMLLPAKDGGGKFVPTGSYQYFAAFSTHWESEYATASFFGAPPGVRLGRYARVPLRLLSGSFGYVNILNHRYSPFGSGWMLNGFERIHQIGNGYAALDNGTGNVAKFTPLAPIHGSGKLNGIALKKQLENKKINLDSSKGKGITSLIARNGTIYASDCGSNVVYKINYLGHLEVIAGNGERGFSGDNGNATEAKLNCPFGVYPTEDGGVVIADSGNFRIRKVKNGIINTIAGNGINEQGPDMANAKNVGIGIPTSISEDKLHSIFFTTDNKVRFINPRGKLETYSGSQSGYVQTDLKNPTQVTFDERDYPVIVDKNSDRLIKLYPQARKVSVLLGKNQNRQEDNDGINDDIRKPVSISFDQSLKRYFILEESGRILMWDGPGNHRLVPLMIEGGLVKQAKNGKMFHKISAMTYSPEVGLVIASEGEVFMAKNNKNNPGDIYHFANDNGVLDELTKWGDGTYTKKTPTGEVVNFNNKGFITGRTYPDGKAISYTYNSSEQLENIILSDGSIYNFDYDFDGRIEKITDPAGRSTTFDTDSQGNLLSINNPDGSNKEFLYNQNHLMTTHVEENGKETQFEYSNGKLVKEILPGGRNRQLRPTVLAGLTVNFGKVASSDKGTPPIVYPTDIFAKDQTLSGDCEKLMTIYNVGAPHSTTDCYGNVTNYFVTSQGQTYMTKTPENRTYFKMFDGKGNTTFTNDEGGRVDYFYNQEWGVVNKIVAENGEETNIAYNDKRLPTTITDESNFQTSFEYNELGLMTLTRDSQGNETSFDHDLNQNLKKIIDPIGSITEMNRDAAGNITSSKDGNGNVTSYVFDSMNRVVEISDPLGFETSFSYTNGGQLASLTNAKNQTTIFNYEPITQKVASITNPENQSEQFFYNGNELLSKKINKDLSEILFQYDLNQNLAQKTLPDDVVQFAFDRDQLLTNVENTHGIVTFTHDNVGRTKTEKPAVGSDTITYEYNNRGLRSRITYGSFYDIRYFYNMRGLLIRMEIQVQDKDYVYERAYDELGRLTDEVLPNGVKTHRTYDFASRLIQLKNTASSNQTISQFDYSFDLNGNITAWTKSFGYQTKKNKNNSVNFGYDKNNRLTSSTDEGNFSLDELGNQLQRNGQFNNLNQLLSDNEFSFNYDLNGNVVVKVIKKTGEKIAYSYNAENKRIKTELKNNQNQITNTINYKHDGLGRRIEKHTSSYSRKFIYDGEKIIAELNENGQLIALYVHAPEVDNPLMMFRNLSNDGSFSNSEIFSYTKDHLGSTRELIDQNQKLLQRYDYSAYGKMKVERIQTSGSNNKFIENPFCYTGRELELETGDQLNNFRWYDSRTGRWFSEDPEKFADSTNAYLYVNGNPLSYTDPTGEFLIAPMLAGAVIGALTEMGTQYLSGKTKCGGFDVGAILKQAAIGAAFSGVVAGVGKTVSILQKLQAGPVKFGTNSRQFILAKHGPHHNFPILGNQPHIQLNTFKPGVKDSGWTIFRLPF